MTVAPGKDKCCGPTAGQHMAYLEGDQFCLKDNGGNEVLTDSVISVRALSYFWGYRLEAKPPAATALDKGSKTMVFCINNNTAEYHFGPSAVLPNGVAAATLNPGVTIATNLS